MPGYSKEYTWVSGSTASMNPPSPNAGCDDDGVMFSVARLAAADVARQL